MIDKRADPIYQDPEVFFEHTYPTKGLRHLLRDALFDGSWDRYKQVKALTEALGKQADKVHHKEQYQQRLKYVEDNGILSVQTSFWKLESECRRVIEQAAFQQR